MVGRQKLVSIFGRNNRSRSSIEIIADMLKVISSGGGAKKTHIMYRSNLNTLQLRKYMRYAVSRGLVSEEKDDNGKIVRYKITEKGKEFIKLYDQIVRIVG